MADFDQAVVNLQRFLGLVVNATSAVEQVEEHVVENGRRFGELEEEAAQHGSALNDGLETLGTTLEAEEGEAVNAFGELTQAGAAARQDVTEVDAKTEQAATDLDQAAAAVESGVEQASTRLDDEGFEPLHHALETAQQELDASSQEAEQALTELVATAATCESEAEAAWDEAEAELDAAATALAAAETAIEAEAQEGAQAFDAAADAFEGACGSLVTEVDGIYDALDGGVAAQGQEWEQAVDAAAQEALAFATDAREQRLEASAQMVDDEALGSLSQEYEALGALLDAVATPLGELPPLSAELMRAQAVVGQIDELMNALS